MHPNHANQERFRQFKLRHPYWAWIGQEKAKELWAEFLKTYKDSTVRLPGTYDIKGRKISD